MPFHLLHMALKPRKPISPEQARLRMAGLCASSEHCEYEIREKLRKMKISSAQAEEIIDFLLSNKFIDNARFARSYTNDKLHFSFWGRNKIRMGLAQKRIPRSIIAESLENIDEDEYQDIALRVALSKSKNIDLSDRKSRESLYRHLLSRGFESSLTSKVIRLIIKRRSDEDI